MKYFLRLSDDVWLTIKVKTDDFWVEKDDPSAETDDFLANTDDLLAETDDFRAEADDLSSKQTIFRWNRRSLVIKDHLLLEADDFCQYK